jgi:hypothetical protein
LVGEGWGSWKEGVWMRGVWNGARVADAGLALAFASLASA